MAAINRGKKKGHLQKKSKRQRGPKRNGTKQRKLPSNQKNVCVIRLPKTSHLRTCPLVSWYFNKRTHNNVFLVRRHKGFGRFFCGCQTHKASLQAGKQKKNQRTGRAYPEFLKAVLKEVARKKRAKWVVAPVKRRPRCSDDEIFYRLASDVENKGSSGFDTDAGASDMVKRPLTLFQPITNEPQSVSS